MAIILIRTLIIFLALIVAMRLMGKRQLGELELSELLASYGFLTDARYMTAYREVRGRFIGEPYPASTLVIVSGLADPGMMVEIEVVAAK